MANPLKGWRVNPADITTVGHDLRRPECVLAEKTGDLWCADLRGGVMHIRPDGSQEVIAPRNGGGPFAGPNPSIDGNGGFSMPNGLCFDVKGDFVIANFGTNKIESLTRAGDYKLLVDEVGGRKLGKANFPAIDSKGRLWFSVTASAESWATGRVGQETDGYIVLVEDPTNPKSARTVGTGFAGTNELRFDEKEEWLYVAETGGGHISRLRIQPDGSLTDRQIYGPEKIGGNPDGFAFDAYGNIWTTLVVQDQLVAITPEGDVLILWEDGDREVKKRVEEERIRGGGRRSLGAAPGDGLAPRMASITFGGPDLCTVYIGSLLGPSLPTFRSPVPGRPLSHWGKSWSR